MAAKTDMERIGLFSEMGYTSIGDPYVPPNSSDKRIKEITWGIDTGHRMLDHCDFAASRVRFCRHSVSTMIDKEGTNWILHNFCSISHPRTSYLQFANYACLLSCKLPLILSTFTPQASDIFTSYTSMSSHNSETPPEENFIHFPTSPAKVMGTRGLNHSPPHSLF